MRRGKVFLVVSSQVFCVTQSWCLIKGKDLLADLLENTNDSEHEALLVQSCMPEFLYAISCKICLLLLALFADRIAT